MYWWFVLLETENLGEDSWNVSYHSQNHIYLILDSPSKLVMGWRTLICQYGGGWYLNQTIFWRWKYFIILKSGKLHVLLRCNSLVGQICYLAKFPVWVGRKSSTLDLNPKSICKMFRWLSYLDSMSKLPAKDEAMCMVINSMVSWCHSYNE